MRGERASRRGITNTAFVSSVELMTVASSVDITIVAREINILSISFAENREGEKGDSRDLRGAAGGRFCRGAM